MVVPSSTTGQADSRSSRVLNLARVALGLPAENGHAVAVARPHRDRRARRFIAAPASDPIRSETSNDGPSRSVAVQAEGAMFPSSTTARTREENRLAYVAPRIVPYDSPQ